MYRRCKLCVTGMFAGAVAEAICILCIPLTGIGQSVLQRAGAYALAAVFWLGLAAELSFARAAAVLCRRIRMQRNEPLSQSRVPGVFRFCKCPEGVVADVLLGASAVGVILFTRLQPNVPWGLIVSLACAIFFLHLHAIFNGGSYQFLRFTESKQRGSSICIQEK